MAIHDLKAELTFGLEIRTNVHLLLAIIASGRVWIIIAESWFYNFYPGGNSNEVLRTSISYVKGQTNSYLLVVYRGEEHHLIIDSVVQFKLHNSLSDSVGESAVLIRPIKPSFKWKFIGKDNDYLNPQPRSSTEYDQNVLIYRLADVYLMKAEALIMQDKYSDAAPLIQKIRDRAGMQSPMPTISNQSDGLDVLLAEDKDNILP
jgi:hypothetical protein